MTKVTTEIFPIPFILTGDTIDCTHLDFRLYGLHKKETFDANGDIILIEYYTDYDAVNAIFSGLAVSETRIYVRDINTGLLLTRVTDIDWYDDQGAVQTSNLQITKYFSSSKGFKANKRARQNIIDKASMYLFSELIAADPLTAEANVDNFESLTDSAQSKYIKSNTQPLLDIITNSTDDQTPDYRAYITTTIRDTLLAILNITYN